MAKKNANGDGTPDNPWVLKTPPRSKKLPEGKEFTAYRDTDAKQLVVKDGAYELRYDLRCIEDLHAMLKKHGDWMPLGAADEKADAKEGTVEAWARSPANPIGGWYGQKKNFRGRFGTYVPPVLEALGLGEVEHNEKNNRMRAR